MQAPIGSRTRADGDARWTLDGAATRSPGRQPTRPPSKFQPIPPRSARGKEETGASPLAAGQKNDTAVVPARRPPLRARFLLPLPSQCPCHVKPTARQARVAARDPIIGCLRLAPCSHALRATAMVPARLLSLLPCRAPGSPFLFASSPVHTSPHVTPHFRSSSLRGITRFHLQTPALLLAPSPLRFFPRATYLDHDLPRSCACALPEL